MVSGMGFGNQFREVWRRRAPVIGILGRYLAFRTLEVVVMSKGVQGIGVWGEGRPRNRLEPRTVESTHFGGWGQEQRLTRCKRTRKRSGLGDGLELGVGVEVEVVTSPVRCPGKTGL